MARRRAQVSEVDHPDHYGGESNPYEVIKVLRAWLTPKELQGFCKGTALKYLGRAGKKPGETTVRDLDKAQWYLSFIANEMRENGISDKR